MAGGGNLQTAFEGDLDRIVKRVQLAGQGLEDIAAEQAFEKASVEAIPRVTFILSRLPHSDRARAILRWLEGS